jgi:2-dehydro-3-deoxygluconokinase
MPDATIICVGECMVEVAASGPGTAQFGYGGDTLNTAVYLARMGVRTAYATALGTDPYSDEMVALWRREGIDTAPVLRCAGRLPGLYVIRTDERGERQFFYWRDRAPARDLLELPESGVVQEQLTRAAMIYFSGITLSIFSDAGRDAFFTVLQAARARGGRIAFDGNYRPRGWPGRAAAQAVFNRFLPLVTHALPTFDDEAMLFGDTDPPAALARLRAAGVAEIAMKCGPDGVLVEHAEGRVHIPVPQVLQPVDTTAAGDSFNAGYLAARLAGQAPGAAALQGHRLAGAVIAHRGAIIPVDAMPQRGADDANG